jgi:flagellar biosynthesis/type III secretory pathway protein FliH
MSDVQPFLGFAPRPTTTASRSFADALGKVDVPVQPSPWSPKNEAAPAAQAVDVDAIRAEAAARGREEGLAETAKLRTQLAALVTSIETQNAKRAASIADLVADAACTVIGAWTATTDRRELFAPLVKAWTGGDHGAATARVNPADVDALRTTLVDIKPASTVDVVADASVAPGNIIFRGGAAELSHCWDERLAELRQAIAAAIEAKP